MGFKSLTFPGTWWLLPLAALAAAAPAAATPHTKSGPAKEAFVKSTLKDAAQPEPRPALWLLADEDTKIYMFGTIHVLPPGFRWRSPAVERAVGEADTLVVETYEPPGTERGLEDQTGFFAERPVPILERVPKSKRKPLREAISAAGLPLDFLDRMHSWAAAMTLGIAQTLGAYGVDDPAEAPGVEDVLEETFRGAGKPILSVEDGDTVFAALSELPQDVQTQLLLDAIEPAPAGAAEIPAAGELEWVAGRDEAMSLEGEAGFPPALFDVLVRRRNAAWTVWLEDRLKQPGTLLFAVGAGHLAGRESVQAMLARRGLRVTRVD
ncbi:MAG TPA: TraB/GumN family protein [Allosphingosinicella sp.]|nr:TraB/GumN family protein [Allosphingosinicella sp.]